MKAEFARVLATLASGEVEFILIDGLAATLHGSARFTYYVDVVYHRTHENLERIIAALGPFHPYLRGAPPGLPFVWDVRTLRNGLNFTFTTDLGMWTCSAKCRAAAITQSCYCTPQRWSWPVERFFAALISTG